MNEILLAIAMTCNGYSNSPAFTKTRMEAVVGCNKKMLNCFKSKVDAQKTKGLLNRKEDWVLYIECVSEDKFKD